MAKKHTVKNVEVFMAVETLNSIFSKPVNTKEGMALSLAFRRLVRDIDPILKDINDIRADLVERYSEKDKDGNVATDENGNVKFVEGGQVAFLEAFDSLMSQSVVIAHPVPISALIDGAEWLGEMDAQSLSTLYPLCEE